MSDFGKAIITCKTLSGRCKDCEFDSTDHAKFCNMICALDLKELIDEIKDIKINETGYIIKEEE